EVFMTEIYAAGEAPIAGVSSEALFERLREILGLKVRLFPRQGVEESVSSYLRPGDCIIVLRAGDITSAGKILLEKIREKQPKLTVGVLFGGASAEHDVSLMSAKNVLSNLDPTLYRIKQFGVTKDGDWIFGENAFEKLLEKREKGQKF